MEINGGTLKAHAEQVGLTYHERRAGLHLFMIFQHGLGWRTSFQVIKSLVQGQSISGGKAMTRHLTMVLIATTGIQNQACTRVTCGTGTVLADKVCEVAEQDVGTLECGPGTFEEDGECVGDQRFAVRCPAGTVLRDDVCIPWNYDEWLNMPFPSGDNNYYVSQGHHGYFSHNGSSLYAIDFPLSEGTPFAAVRAGRVIKYREDSDTGCELPECANQANYIEIDHGDGSLGRYWHLEYDGVDVEVGDWVNRGEVLGRTGNTGFSTGPHLHLEVTDLYRMSVPVLFRELKDISDGVISAGMWIKSENIEVKSAEQPFYECGRETFLHMGVALEPGTPCTVATIGQSYTVSGQVVELNPPLMAIINRYDVEAGEWMRTCVNTDEDGRFEAELSFPEAERANILIAKAGGDCWAVQGWSSSPRLTLIP